MEDITLRKALGEYEAIYMAYRNFAERTREEYINDLQGFIKFAEKSGVNYAKSLGLSIIQRFIASLEQKGYSSLTRKRKVVTLRSFFSFLYQEGYIHTDVASKIILPFTETTTPKVLTPEECDRLRAVCSTNKRDRAIIELLLHTGITLSELTRLTSNDIVLAKLDGSEQNQPGFVRIIGKRAKKERVVPLYDRVSHALKSYLEIREKTGTSTLFLNRFEESLRERGLQKILKKYFRKAGIGRASVHTLRHTFGIYQTLAGMNINTLQAVMGHRDIRSTMIYVSLMREMRKDTQNNSLWTRAF